MDVPDEYSEGEASDTTCISTSTNHNDTDVTRVEADTQCPHIYTRDTGTQTLKIPNPRKRSLPKMTSETLRKETNNHLDHLIVNNYAAPAPVIKTPVKLMP